jgi:hypothetical protein
LSIPYFLNKGEAITFQEHQYFIYSRMIQYGMDQHKCASNAMALIDQGAAAYACGDDIFVLEGSD